MAHGEQVGWGSLDGAPSAMSSPPARCGWLSRACGLQGLGDDGIRTLDQALPRVCAVTLQLVAAGHTGLADMGEREEI